jgi:hypothetical protein
MFNPLQKSEKSLPKIKSKFLLVEDDISFGTEWIARTFIFGRL